MIVISQTWLEILSDLFVNIAAGWFALVFIEPQLASVLNISALILRFLSGMMSLMIAKQFKEEAKNL
ncbi:hypothetical protein HY086_06915 [Candidatus Gottesmanbacteria bacterium]|nr:hypothetical protein [Candidatus Gottesmanbacteria bacterium]